MLTWAWASTATQPKTGRRTAHSLPRVALSFPTLKIRDQFPDAAGLRSARILQAWISGDKDGHKGQKRSGFRVVVMDRGLGL